ncbi:MAG: DUF6531 domain-containing protein, partial [Verrucomicrobia bacterium]|nr:DUF6531 domain-containing protein [Verrucomicrobiota bacterium]
EQEMNQAVAGIKGAPAWSVNVINMNLFVEDIPLWYKNPAGPSVEVALSYNSQSAIAQHEPFGSKWQFNYGTYLVEDTAGTVLIFMSDGRRDTFTPDGTGGYTPPTLVHNRLAKLTPTRYELRFPDDTVYEYDIPPGTESLQPFLVRMQDACGVGLTFGYDTNANLTTVSDSWGRVTSLTYSNGLCTRVSDPFGRHADFAYD